MTPDTVRAISTGLFAILATLIFGTVAWEVIPRVSVAPGWRRRSLRFAIALVKYPTAAVMLMVGGLAFGVGMTCIIIAAAIADGFERLTTRLEVPQS